MFVVKSEVRKYLLHLSKLRRNGKFNRVGGDVYEYLDGVVREAMDKLMHSHPSVGKTITTK